MDNLFTFLWQSNLCLLVFYLGYKLWLKHERCFYYRRYYILLTPLLSFAIPLLKFPSVSRTYYSSLNLPTISLSELVISTQDRQELMMDILIGLYLVVSFGLLCLVIFRMFQTIRRIRRCTKAAEGYRGHSIYYTEGQLPSSSYYHYLLIDNTYPMEPDQRQLILEHEMVHIDQRHSYDLLFFELLKVVYWYNPVVWLLPREISEVHEFIADDVVVNDRNRDLYLETLAQRTLYQLQIPWATNFNFNNNLTLNRITMIQSHARNTRLWKYGIFLGLYVFLHVLVACTDEQPISDNTPDEVYNMVDERPAPINGMEGFYQELAGVLKYPKKARTMGIEGKVYLSFVVQETGELTDITVLKGIGAGCDIAAKDALSNVSNWSPGILNGKPVKVLMTLPVVFKLSPDDTAGDKGQG